MLREYKDYGPGSPAALVWTVVHYADDVDGRPWPIDRSVRTFASEEEAWRFVDEAVAQFPGETWYVQTLNYLISDFIDAGAHGVEDAFRGGD